MATMPLLNPSNTYNLHSSLLDAPAAMASQEWNMYTEVDPKTEYPDERIPSHRQGSEQLAKATKDLMSLDTASLRWSESADRLTAYTPIPSSSTHASTSNATGSGLTRNFNSSFRHQPPSVLSQTTQLNGFVSPQSPSMFSGSMAHLERPPLTVAPNHTLDNRSPTSRQSLSSFSSEPSPSPPTPPSTKRSHPSPSDLSLQTIGASSSQTYASSKKRKTSPSDRPNAVLSGSSGSGSGKPALLSPSQKKANHIQSEQKRRANIRRGYDALCDTVPALREAIRQEEEEQAAQAAADGRSKGRKKNRKKNAALLDAEKTDGRAGPKSENVVLQKTIDYINDLLDERTVLLNRMKRARSYLTPGHPALQQLSDQQPLWEREWSGGLGILDDIEGGDGDSDDDDGDSQYQ